MRRWVRNRTFASTLAAMLAAAPALAADEFGDTGAVDWGKAFDYTMCAVGIATAVSGAGALFATFTCGKLIIRYWD